MPRPRHAQGRPDTRVVPVDWNETHSPVVAKALRGTCTLREPGADQAWDAALEEMVETPKAPYYDGACRVQALNGEARIIRTAGDRQVVADYLIVVPLAVAGSEQDLVTVTDGDPLLAGAVLQVLHVVRGTERFERDLYCTLTS